ncbi:hypothetical protein [Bacillus altitudinis]|uniref:hypothetical protein n=1 Tax=Bacillus altitudinis TaxID=293387 RepID=UPI000541E00C|nr:hypothetical protein [Bacillus altitudinis]KWZ68174.1 hypothetical protein HQ51_0205560 [Bacillus altitudinis]MCM3046676.1 hypothetical protein [Bacillus altitudinis]MEC1805147.1 hypothetical protein [Bacillus altitudinis]
MKKYSLSEIMTTSELAQKLGYNQSYVLRLVKTKLTEGVDYRSAGRRNFLFTKDALSKLQEHLNQTT